MRLLNQIIRQESIVFIMLLKANDSFLGLTWRLNHWEFGGFVSKENTTIDTRLKSCRPMYFLESVRNPRALCITLYYNGIKRMVIDGCAGIPYLSLRFQEIIYENCCKLEFTRIQLQYLQTKSLIKLILLFWPWNNIWAIHNWLHCVVYYSIMQVQKDIITC